MLDPHLRTRIESVAKSGGVTCYRLPVWHYEVNGYVIERRVFLPYMQNTVHMMYELLSGKPVFPFETVADAALAHVGKAPEPPSARAPRAKY